MKKNKYLSRCINAIMNSTYTSYYTLFCLLGALVFCQAFQTPESIFQAAGKPYWALHWYLLCHTTRRARGLAVMPVASINADFILISDCVPYNLKITDCNTLRESMYHRCINPFEVCANHNWLTCFNLCLIRTITLLTGLLWNYTRYCGGCI